ncbi:MAG: hypothetical protein VKI82_04080 [Leptolyngbya sp.]|nr:hypothetical protein [Leptolyngbya sp.]
MESIKLKSHIGNDGILQVQVPDDFKNQNFEILIVFQPISNTESQEDVLLDGKPESRGWCPSFFETTIGRWEGEPLERPPQLPYEVREDLTFGEKEAS